MLACPNVVEWGGKRGRPDSAGILKRRPLIVAGTHASEGTQQSLRRTLAVYYRSTPTCALRLLPLAGVCAPAKAPAWQPRGRRASHSAGRPSSVRSVRPGSERALHVSAPLPAASVAPLVSSGNRHQTTHSSDTSHTSLRSRSASAYASATSSTHTPTSANPSELTFLAISLARGMSMPATISSSALAT